MKWFLLALLLPLTACSTLDKTGSIDLTQRSITIPPGAAMAPIKSELMKGGWAVRSSKAYAATGSLVTSSTVTEGVHTRYGMTASLTGKEHRFPDFEHVFDYDISIVDVKTNEEVLTMSGFATSRDIGRKLVKALNAR